MKYSEIKKKLEELGVEFKGNASKQDLQLLLDQTLANLSDKPEETRLDAVEKEVEQPKKDDMSISTEKYGDGLIKVKACDIDLAVVQKHGLLYGYDGEFAILKETE